MRKLLSVCLITITSLHSLKAQNNNLLLDQPVKLKSVIIRIDADPFTATTFIEMEFYNSHDREIEGLYRFQLNPGQVITAFQLDLNGKYRDGTIEEKWKASNAYNTIVGKRIDPALLQMEGLNFYRLNVYPVPPKGSRKIKMTIQQRMKGTENQTEYLLPFKGKDTATYFKTTVHVQHTPHSPFVSKGLLMQKTFASEHDGYSLRWESEDVALSRPLAFTIPFGNRHFVYCTKQVEEKKYFALHYRPSAQLYTRIHPKKITVFWDASASGDKRQTGKEINFLQQYISYHGISQLTIIPFNYKITDTAVFYTGNGFNSRWQQYIRSLEYDGATQLGILDFSVLNSDAVFLFSDGVSTYGKNLPKTGNALVYCISSSASANIAALKTIPGSGGGCCIDLNKNNTGEAISLASRSENWLLNIVSSNGKTVYEQSLPVRINSSLFFNGITGGSDDTLIFYFGTNNAVSKTEKLYINNSGNCSASVLERVNMLEQFEKILDSYSWENMLEFGLKEKVVTYHTSYIVLERVEDYIKYNISPPKDLEEECTERGYVKKDSRTLRKQLKERDEFDIVNAVTGYYNRQLEKWDPNTYGILLSKKDMLLSNVTTGNTGTGDKRNVVVNGKTETGGPQFNPQSSLSEVVVVGYSAVRKRSLTGAVAYVHSDQLNLSAMNIGEALSGKVAGVQVTGRGQPGADPLIRIRGAGSVLANSEPLYVVDGMQVSGGINGWLNVNDIESITILKDAVSTALYGSRGANGVIVIETKKAKPYWRYSYPSSPYRLKDMEDVEYLQEIKWAEKKEKWNLYRQLKKSYGEDPGFYFDIAQHLFDIGMKTEAIPVLMNATETADGDYRVLKAIGYVLESWKYFKEAAEVYYQVLQLTPGNLYAYRDLAWAYFQQGKYQEAVDLLYKAITKNFDWQEDHLRSFKALLLSEMNAIIAVHGEAVDVSAIPAALIRPMPVDLRIVVDGNKMDFYNVSIREPGGSVCSVDKPTTKKGGYINQEVYSYYYNGPQEYNIRIAPEGRYRVSVNYYDYYPDHIPSFIRITVFKNFGAKGQAISIENVIMDHQAGTIEIGEVKW